MKPDWKDAPEWATWLARDGNGEWFWYADEPSWHAESSSWAPSFMTKVLHAGASDAVPIEERPCNSN